MIFVVILSVKLVIYDLIDSTSEKEFIKTLYERIINLMNIWTKLEKAFMFIRLLLLLLLYEV